LLDDPAVHDWLAQHRPALAPAPAPTADAEFTPSGYLAYRIAAIRAHVASLVAAVPRVPAEMERAGIILSLEFEERGLWRVLLLIVGFVALGFGAERLYYWVAAPIERWIVALPLDTVGQRPRAAGIRPR